MHLEAADAVRPDVIFEKEWTFALLDRVTEQLAAEY